jgi:hypothetical protein
MANIDIERRPETRNLAWIIGLLVLAAVAAYFLFGRGIDL